jgi:hypothetical protein
MRNLALSLLLVVAVSISVQVIPTTAIAANDGINPMDSPFNAVCDGVADDSQAFSAALDAIVAEQGARKVTVPKGRTCKIGTPIVKDFQSTNDIIIEGTGSGSVLLLATGNRDAFVFQNAYSITIRDLTIKGNPAGGAKPDANVGITFDTVFHVLMDNNQIYGTFTPGGMIKSIHSNLVFTNNKLRGSTTVTGNVNGVVFSRNWKGMVVKYNTFLDFGSLNGEWHSKTPTSTPLAWIAASEPEGEINEEIVGTQPPSQANAYAQNAIEITNNFFDEGALRAVQITSNPSNGEAKTARVYIARNNSNAAGVAGSIGYYLQNIRSLVVDQVYVGYVYNRDVPGMYLDRVENATIKGSFFLQRAGTIKTVGAGQLTLEDTTYKVLETDGATTVRLLQKGKRISRTPAAGIHPYDNLTAIASNIETIYGAPVAAAAELIPTGNVFQVYGSGVISGINSSRIEPGTSLTLIFGEGNPSVVAGVNLKIGRAFVASPGDTLSVVYSDGVFYETGRRVNSTEKPL